MHAPQHKILELVTRAEEMEMSHSTVSSVCYLTRANLMLLGDMLSAMRYTHKSLDMDVAVYGPKCDCTV